MYKTVLIFIAIMLTGAGGIFYMFDQQRAVSTPTPVEKEYDLLPFGTECYNENGTAHLEVVLENTGEKAISMTQTRFTITTVTDELMMNRTYNLSAAGMNKDPTVDEPANISGLDKAPIEPGEIAGYQLEIVDTRFDAEARYEIDIRVSTLDQTITETCQIPG